MIQGLPPNYVSFEWRVCDGVNVVYLFLGYVYDPQVRNRTNNCVPWVMYGVDCRFVAALFSLFGLHLVASPRRRLHSILEKLERVAH